MTDQGKPETLYELCEQVCEAIATRPSNYCQEQWSVPACQVDSKDPNQREVCGTAYCRAGWMVALTSDSKELPIDISGAAIGLLCKANIPLYAIDRLFRGGACLPLEHGEEGYATEGVRGMREFMSLHETALKGAPL